MRTLITRDYAAAFEKVDVILSPVAPTTAFKIGEICDPTEMYLADMFTISINIAGNGGMSFPIGLGADTGLPVGVQIIAPPSRTRTCSGRRRPWSSTTARRPLPPISPTERWVRK
ncbi:MAG: amidase family protein [Adlercreutzia equolifaciens]